jgi:LDH2 family malate/lactate/ureidoglycolate dehydrogenase
LLEGGIVVKPKIRVIRETPATAVMDGGGGAGHIVGHHAMNVAIDKAQQTGVGCVTVKNSNHFGTNAYFTMMALSHRMIGMVTTNGIAGMPVYGGKTPVFGNDPIAIAVPTGRDLPIVLDMATSVVAAGKIGIAKLKDEKIPRGWAYDKNGEPTDDPNDYFDGGSLVPLGGYKGSGLTVGFEILSAVLSGARYATHAIDWPKHPDTPQDTGHFMMALKIEAFMEWDEFKRRVQDFMDILKNSEPAKGFEEIYLPGEIEFKTAQERSAKGIPLLPKLVEQLQELSAKFNVPLESI